MSPRLVKDKDVVIYRNEQSYSHNPVVEFLRDGSLAVVFREAPRRKLRTHIDLHSAAAMIRSTDGGQTWDPANHWIAYREKGSGIQDPSIRKLKDGTLMMNFFKWTVGGQAELPVDHPWLQAAEAEHYSWTTGVWTTRSRDDGQTWEPPVKVPSPSGDATSTSDPILELPSGELLIPIIGAGQGVREKTMVMRSRDQGRTWVEPSVMAFDPLGQFSFDEPSLLALPDGRVLAMHRSHVKGESDYGYYLYQTESADAGRTWSSPKKTTIWGHPPHLTLLGSGSILCVYGYRRPPFGVRACLSHDGGQTWDIAHELILRADGIDGDVGYPTAVQLPDDRIFIAWYMAQADDKAKHVGEHFSIFAYTSPQLVIGGSFVREE